MERQIMKLRTTTLLSVLLATTFLATAACSDDPVNPGPDDNSVRPDLNNPNPGTDTGEQPGTDTGSNNPGGPDASPGDNHPADDDAGHLDDAGEPPEVVIPEQGCADVFQAGQTWNADSAGATGQALGTLAYDGEALWIAYARPRSAMGDTALYVTRMGCDGTQLVPPREVTGPENHRTPIPVMTYNNGQVYVAWTSQNNETGVWNAYMRVLGRDGAGQFSDPTIITPLIDGEPASITVWEPALAPLPGGGAILAVSALTVDGGRILLQRVDEFGVRDGNAFFVYPPAGEVSQNHPTLSVGDDGTIYVAYVQGPFGGNQIVYHTVFAPGSTKPEPEIPQVAHPTQQPNTFGKLSKSSGGPNTVPWLAFHVSSTNRADIYLKDAAQPGLASHYTEFGVANRTNHRPAVDASATGGAMVWYSANSSIQRNQVNVQRFTANLNGSFQLAERVAIPMEQEAIPYGASGPDIVHLFDHVYALTWSEGDGNLTTRLKVRLVNLQ
jgi:hypothetical protein